MRVRLIGGPAVEEKLKLRASKAGEGSAKKSTAKDEKSGSEGSKLSESKMKSSTRKPSGSSELKETAGKGVQDKNVVDKSVAGTASSLKTSMQNESDSSKPGSSSMQKSSSAKIVGKGPSTKPEFKTVEMPQFKPSSDTNSRRSSERLRSRSSSLGGEVEESVAKSGDESCDESEKKLASKTVRRSVKKATAENPRRSSERKRSRSKGTDDENSSKSDDQMSQTSKKPKTDKSRRTSGRKRSSSIEIEKEKKPVEVKATGGELKSGDSTKKSLSKPSSSSRAKKIEPLPLLFKPDRGFVAALTKRSTSTPTKKKRTQEATSTTNAPKFVEVKESDAVKLLSEGSELFLQGSKLLPESSKSLTEGPKLLPDGPKLAPEGSKFLPEGPKLAPEGSKSLPEGPKSTSESSQKTSAAEEKKESEKTSSSESSSPTLVIDTNRSDGSSSAVPADVESSGQDLEIIAKDAVHSEAKDAVKSKAVDDSEEMEVDTATPTGTNLDETETMSAAGVTQKQPLNASTEISSMQIDDLESDSQDSSVGKSESDVNDKPSDLQLVALPSGKLCLTDTGIFAANSPVFANLIQKHKSTARGITRIEVEIEDSVFHLFVTNIEEPGPLTYQEAKTLLPLSLKFQVEELKTRCLTTLAEVTDENALELKFLALKVKHEDLSKIADNRLEANLKTIAASVAKSEYLRELTFDQFCELIDPKTTNLPLECLEKLTQNWLGHKGRGQNKNILVQVRALLSLRDPDLYKETIFHEMPTRLPSSEFHVPDWVHLQSIVTPKKLLTVLNGLNTQHFKDAVVTKETIKQEHKPFPTSVKSLIEKRRATYEQAAGDSDALMMIDVKPKVDNFKIPRKIKVEPGEPEEYNPMRLFSSSFRGPGRKSFDSQRMPTPPLDETDASEVDSKKSNHAAEWGTFLRQKESERPPSPGGCSSRSTWKDPDEDRGGYSGRRGDFSGGGRGRGGRGGGGRGGHSGNEDSWPCDCGYATNYASRSSCYKCHKPRPGGDADGFGGRGRGRGRGGDRGRGGWRGGRGGGGGFGRRDDDNNGGNRNTSASFDDDWSTGGNSANNSSAKVSNDDEDWGTPSGNNESSQSKSGTVDDNWDTPSSNNVTTQPETGTDDGDWGDTGGSSGPGKPGGASAPSTQPSSLQTDDGWGDDPAPRPAVPAPIQIKSAAVDPWGDDPVQVVPSVVSEEKTELLGEANQSGIIQVGGNVVEQTEVIDRASSESLKSSDDWEGTETNKENSEAAGALTLDPAQVPSVNECERMEVGEMQMVAVATDAEIFAQVVSSSSSAIQLEEEISDMDFSVSHDETMPVGSLEVKQSSDGIDGDKGQVITSVQSDVIPAGEEADEWS